MIGTACAEPGCPGALDDLGYCDTCGTKGHVEASGGPTAAGVSQATAAVAAGGPCPEGCGGTIAADGYCDTCGAKAGPPTRAAGAAAAAGSPLSALAASTRTTPFAGGSSSGSRRERTDSTRTSSRRSGIGAGIVSVDPVATVDPTGIIMDPPEVREDKRFCSSCGEPVGRSKGKREGRLEGFCPNCRARYDFVPKLQPGEMVAGQYEVVGPIAHGGLGWIYLARDTAVSGRWVVLKGLLNAGDEAAMAAAVAERRFLAQVQHPHIVEIYNFATHKGAGYTVMEYVGGRSLKQLLKQRREAAGTHDPMPVEQAIAYILAVLPAFEYLHDQSLVYCDFKPDNLIQVGDSVKLIDLGGVRRLGDHAADIYGTVGFQAPEVPSQGTTIASDLYTIGRTLAVLTLDFRGYTSVYVDSLPDPADHPALRDNEPFYRFLRKACAPHPDDRFQSAGVMAEQLLGVLRIIVAARTGQPQPGASHEFTGAPVGDQLLPWLAVDPSDDAAAFLARMSDDPAEALAELDQAVRDGQLTETVEVRLRAASDLAEAGSDAPAGAVARWKDPLTQTHALLDDDPWNWRAVWVQAYARLLAGDLEGAAADIDRVRSEVPGELAPLYAAAVAAERAGDRALAEALYDLVSTVDPSWVTASMGLGRVRADAGDVDGALQGYQRVPATHRAYATAQRELVVVLTGAGRYADAMQRLDGAGAIAGEDRERLRVGLLEAALTDIEAGRIQEDHAATIGDVAQTDRALRAAAEAAYRRLARATDDASARHALVDRANQVRPLTLL